MIINKIRVKFFTAGNKRSATNTIRAGKGKMFTPQGIEHCLSKLADGLEARCPDDEFSCVQIGPASYNFVWVGKRKEQTAADLYPGPIRVALNERLEEMSHAGQQDAQD